MFTDLEDFLYGSLDYYSKQNEDHVYVELSVPGLKKEDLTIKTVDGGLSIILDYSNCTYLAYAKRKREFKVNIRNLDEDKIEANLQDGVLIVKAYQNIQTKEIKIN